jgi:hypothetical protein
VQRNWSAVRDELNAKLRQSDCGYQSLAASAGVGYYAARRFILHGATNCTQTAKKLCIHFGIPLAESAKPQGDKLEELTALVQEVWDGTGPHAELLAKLIRSTRAFKVQDRAK